MSDIHASFADHGSWILRIPNVKQLAARPHSWPLSLQDLDFRRRVQAQTYF